MHIIFTTIVVVHICRNDVEKNMDAYTYIKTDHIEVCINNNTFTKEYDELSL